jgi:hypothetical protein
VCSEPSRAPTSLPQTWLLNVVDGVCWMGRTSRYE